LQKFCNTSHLVTHEYCNEFDILPPKNCYAIKWQNWADLFKESSADDALSSLNESYFVHLWNAKSKHKKMPKTSRAAFNQIAALYCPRVFQSNSQI
jgi:hypothetical protein